MCAARCIVTINVVTRYDPEVSLTIWYLISVGFLASWSSSAQCPLVAPFSMLPSASPVDGKVGLPRRRDIFLTVSRNRRHKGNYEIPESMPTTASGDLNIFDVDVRDRLTVFYIAPVSYQEVAHEDPKEHFGTQLMQLSLIVLVDEFICDSCAQRFHKTFERCTEHLSYANLPPATVPHMFRRLHFVNCTSMPLLPPTSLPTSHSEPAPSGTQRTTLSAVSLV